VLRAIAPRLLPPYLRPAPPSPPAATAEDDSARPVAEESEAAQAPAAEGSKTAPAEVASPKKEATAGSEVGSPAEKAAGESTTTEAGKGGGALGSASATINGSLLLVGYIANWLPFMLVERVAFIYHFLPALLHALLLLGIVVDVGVPNVPLIAHRRPLLAAHGSNGGGDAPVVGTEAAHAPATLRWVVSGALIYAFAGCFAFFAPFAYGTALTKTQMEARFWLDTWR